ncbi:MAG: methionine--tRNA ligase [Saprospiraceae bacterium]|nr:methionine--tRNA ligase [Saprospiraceae bacterium]
MGSTKNRLLVTSALPYANGALHLGHLAGAYLPADIYVRYKRLMGKDVLFVCGSDEHGAAITIRAKKEGISPKEIIDKYHNLNKDTFQKLGISFDFYHRTSAPLHHETAQEFFKKLLDKGGEFEERTTDQYYDAEYNQFLADRYIKGTCPHCEYEEAFGDQCENCGRDLSPTELIKPVSTLSGKKPELKSTSHWYFRLDNHEEWLRKWIQEGTLEGQAHHDPRSWKKHVIGQCLSWLDSGLQPRAITRDLDWGIPVPVEGASNKVLYVWFDAPIGYISATRQWGIDKKGDPDYWKKYWQSPDSELVHFIGKDNIVFHCIVFPAMLKAHGSYQLPVNVPANQFLNFEGQKFSKSRGWGIEQHEYLELFKSFPNKEDALRYALIRNMPENRDADFKWDDFVDYHDKELADNLGNYLNRVIVLTHKYFDGKCPSPENMPVEGLRSLFEKAEEVGRLIEKFSFKAAIMALMEISSFGNTYLQDVSPWKIFKRDPDSPLIKECIFLSLQNVAILSQLIKPFLPGIAKKMADLLGLPAASEGSIADMFEKLSSGESLINPGHKIGDPEILFAKIDDRKDRSIMDIIDIQKEKLAKIMEEQKPKQPSLKDRITYDDFTKLDIRTARILSAEKVKGADKLLKLEVDMGFEKRTLVSGIAKFFKPDEIVGQQVLVLANLAPRKIRGVESNGMVLMAENEEGKLTFVEPKGSWDIGFPVN